MMIVQVQQYSSLYFSHKKSEPDTEPQQNQVSISPFTNTPSLQRTSSKIKTSLCKNFSLQGYCPYSTKCQFAHGPQQLRCNAVANISYKTKPCFSFLQRQYCPYGHRCNFIHKDENKRKNIRQALVQNFPQLLVDAKEGSNSGFLRKLAMK